MTRDLLPEWRTGREADSESTVIEEREYSVDIVPPIIQNVWHPNV